MPPTNSIDDELAQLERDIRQLKVEYDQYFGGGRKRPPTEIEWRIELLVKRYAERSGELKSGQRFRFNNLTQTHAKYKEIFRKRLQQKEEGKVQRHFGAAAKQIEAERSQKQGAVATENSNGKNAGAKDFRVVCARPDEESGKIGELFEAFLRAKQQTGEDTGKLTRSSFNEFILKKTRDLQKQKDCLSVEYVVEVNEGKVKLKALVKS